MSSGYQIMKINDLPDYPAIEQIRDALWRIGETRGAAVMVGAGFSRNAKFAAPNSRRPPIWSDYYDAMARRLYPLGDAPQDPLKLAEEYKAAFGETALESLIFDLVRDTEWLPGPLHDKLLSLPWEDVLTTNWDTLLERAAAVNDRQTYDVVQAVADIPRTKAPRIVKLHGSMPSKRPFIFTEEDYRTYPIVFAPFVNLVQQVLLENELCLIGFSGDDPNFLRWSGWVRDELGAAARRIHLVGVLHISPTRRKYLEARNASPIDLAPLVDGVEDCDKPGIALQHFIDFLINSKPRPAHDWPARGSKGDHSEPAKSTEETRDPIASARRLQKIAALWREERNSYPGWLVCPSEKRQIVRHDTDLGFALQPALEHIDASERGSVIYEIAWRFDIAFWPLLPWLREIFAQAVNDGKVIGLDRQHRLHLGSILLRTAREEGEENSFQQWITFLEAEANGDQDVIAAIRYEQCLWARDHLDYPKLINLVEGVRGQDPAWHIRRAALYCDLGDYEVAADIIREALRDVRNRRARDRKSLWVLSRLAWAMFLARAINLGSSRLTEADDPLTEYDVWPSATFREPQCDPWDELSNLDRELEKAFREKIKNAITKEPRFDAGTYVDRTATMRFVSWAVVSPAYEMARISEVVGLPRIANHMDVMGERLARASELFEAHDERELLTCVRVLRGSSDNRIEKRFGRINVARMPLDIVQRLIDRLWQAIDFGSQRFRQKNKDGQDIFNSSWVERVQYYAELLSRLVVRLQDADATKAFRRAAAYAHDPRWEHWWLFEPLGHLLDRSLTAVSPSNRKNLLMDVLNLPLLDEHKIQGVEHYWPEIIESLGSRSIVQPSDDVSFRQRIATLIEKVKSAAIFSRGRAALRLTYLYEAGCLKPDEARRFGEALWSRRDVEDGFPSDTQFLPHVFLYLPSPDPELPKKAFQMHILSRLLKDGVTEDRLSALIGYVRPRIDGSSTFELRLDEAKAIFDVILTWQPKKVDRDFGQQIQLSNREIERAIGPALAEAVLPVLDAANVGAERIDKLFSLIEKRIVPSAISALPEISRLDPSRLTQIVSLIRRGLLSSENSTVFSAINAIYHWRKRAQDGVLRDCPVELIQDVVAITATRREPGLLHSLHLVTELVADGVLNTDDKTRLTETLDVLSAETTYEHWHIEDPRTTTMTLVRTRCVRLAAKLMATGLVHPVLKSWVDGAISDPIPEVRYALEEAE